MKARALAAVVTMVAAGSLAAQDDYRHARIRHAESGVVIQRSSESVSEEAEANLPFLPGDRVWTDSGRVEFQFGDGSLVRLDGRSKLEYLAAEDNQPSALRLHSGSLFLHAWAADPGFEVETPGGLVETLDRGVYRVDVEGEEVRLSVYEGEASLASGRRRVRVEEGERAYARRGDEPDDPSRFDRGDHDDFARWDADRRGPAAWASDDRQYIPEEVAPYADELDSNGSWYFQVDAGYVWRPYVASGWRPYCHGRWAWTAYGWTWIPQEPWGWAPSHYGRWDYGANLGWYWIPGSSWGAAWVHWAVGPNYVGWCPRGYRDRVVPYDDRGYRGGSHAGGSGAWVYSNRDQMQVGFAARKPVQSAAALREVRVIDAPHARPGRDLRSVETVTKPAFRNIRTKPTVGDWVPELRTDNSTTIPAPVVRRKPSPRYDTGHAPATRAVTRRPETRPRDTDFSGVDPELRSQPRRSTRTWPERTGSSSSSRQVNPRSSGVRTGSDVQPRRRDPEPTVRSDRPDRTDRTDRSDRTQGRPREGTRASDPDRDVLRHMFKPLTDTPRERSSGSSRSGGSSGARERSPESRPRSTESRPASGRSEVRPSSGSRGGSRSESRPAPRAQPSNKGQAKERAPKSRQ